MGDEKNAPLYPTSIRALVQTLSETLDERARSLRKAQGLRDVRPSDAKVAMVIARGPIGLPELSRRLGISRQAAHRSLQRLLELGAISYEHIPGGKREKIATLSPLGERAQTAVAAVVAEIEREIAEEIGEEELERLRATLIRLSEKL